MELSLRVWSMVLGAVHLAAGLAAICRPCAVRSGLERFPRHIGIGRILAAIAIFWAASIVYRAELGRFSWLKPLLWALTPAAWGLIAGLLDELLAPRALGGLLLLLARVVLEAARLHPHAAARAVSVLAYGWVVAGMTLVAAPWQFRRCWAPLLKTPRRLRTTGALGAALGAGLIALAWTVYR